MQHRDFRVSLAFMSILLVSVKVILLVFHWSRRILVATSFIHGLEISGVVQVVFLHFCNVWIDDLIHLVWRHCPSEKRLLCLEIRLHQSIILVGHFFVDGLSSSYCSLLHQGL